MSVTYDNNVTAVSTIIGAMGATKADLAEAKNSIVMCVVSAILLAQLLPAILKKFGL